MTFKKITAALALLLTSATISACSDNNETTSECEEGQVKAQVGDAEAQCYTSCGSDDDCGDGESCTSSLCIADGGTNPDDDMDVVVDGDMGDDMTPVVEEDMGDDMDVIVDEDMNDMGDVVVDANPGTACADASACMGTEAACITEADQGFPAGYCTSSCTSDAQCGSTGVCLIDENGSGLCLAACGSDANCREDYTCQNVSGVAQACFPAPPDYGTIGGECTSDDAGNTADCGEVGLCADDSFGFPGGYCVGPCVGDSDCGEGGNCVADFFTWQDANGTANDNGTCMDACASADDCRDGYGCVDYDTDGVGECVPSNTEGEAPGAACAADGLECSGLLGQCLGEASGFPDAGYCISFCDVEGACIDGSHCSDGIFTGFEICVQDCATDADCGDGLTCQDIDQDGANECMPEQEVANGSGAPGDACASTGDCAGGENGFCISEAGSGFPGGYCTVDCTADEALCVAGSSCAALSDTQSLCLDDCMNTSDCRGDGYACMDLTNGGVAVNTPGSCFVAESCDATTPCADSSTFCVDTATGNFGDAGVCVTLASCSASNACPTGATCLDPNTGMTSTEGLCISDCVGSTANPPCTDGFICAAATAQGFVEAADGEAGLCIPQQ